VSAVWSTCTENGLPVLKLPYIVNITIHLAENVSGQGFIFNEWITFIPNMISPGVYSSDLTGIILNVYDQADPQEIVLTEEATSSVTPAQICADLLGNPDAPDGNTTGVCPIGGPFKHYASCDECLAIMNYVSTDGVNCPNQITANTTDCAFIHATTAQFDPPIHCNHTYLFTSATCVDRCRTVCSLAILGANGVCIGSFVPPLGIETYVASCKSGYTGVPPNCVANTCTRDADCQLRTHGHDSVGISPAYSISCVSGICTCENSFTWNSSAAALTAGNACFCDPNQDVSLQWNRTDPSNPIAQCVQNGRCFQRADCQNSVSNVKTAICEAYGINVFLPPDLLTCVCRPGFLGLPGEDCVCPFNTTQVEHKHNAYCLAPGQCVVHKDCPTHYHCETDPNPNFESESDDDTDTQTVGCCVHN